MKYGRKDQSARVTPDNDGAEESAEADEFKIGYRLAAVLAQRNRGRPVTVLRRDMHIRQLVLRAAKHGHPLSPQRKAGSDMPTAFEFVAEWLRRRRGRRIDPSAVLRAFYRRNRIEARKDAFTPF